MPYVLHIGLVDHLVGFGLSLLSSADVQLHLIAALHKTKLTPYYYCQGDSHSHLESANWSDTSAIQAFTSPGLIVRMSHRTILWTVEHVTVSQTAIRF